MAVVTVVIFAVTHINLVVAVVLNHVMTVEVLTTVALVLSVATVFNRAMALVSTETAAAVMKIVATVIQHRVKQMATQLGLISTVQRDLLAIVHAALATVIQVVIVAVLNVQVAVVQVVTVTLVIVQMLARLTVASVMQQLSVKNLSHVMAQVLHAAKAIVIAVETAQMQIEATTVY